MKDIKKYSSWARALALAFITIFAYCELHDLYRRQFDLQHSLTNAFFAAVAMILFSVVAFVKLQKKRLSQTPTQKHFSKGLALAEQKKFEQAITQFDLCISLDAGNADAFMWRGIIYKSLEQYQKAVDDYTKTLSLEPQIGNTFSTQANRSPLVTQSLTRSLHYDRGCCLAKLGNTEKALDDFTKAISIEPGSAVPHPKRAVLYRERAELYERLGKLDLAKDDREKAVEMDWKDAYGV